MTARAAPDMPPDWINGDPRDLRRWRDSCPEVVNPTLPGDVSIAALMPEADCPGGLLFTPADPGGTPVVYFHGGGFIVGSPETHRVVAAWIAHVARTPVVSVRYRLAPEHPLPAQALDGTAAVRRQLRDHPRLRLMGDSAGAMVALWAFAGLAAQERARIVDAVLFYPGGLAMPHPATAGGDEGGGLGPLSMASCQRRLDPAGIAPGNPAYDPLAPGFALPPATTVVGAGDDPLFYSAQALGGLPGARLVVARGQGHGFLSALPAEAAMAGLRRAIGGGP